MLHMQPCLVSTCMDQSCKPADERPVHGKVLSGSCKLQVGGDLPGGLHVRGLSGGERRRLSIACAVVGAPALIFLDECTSGAPGQNTHTSHLFCHICFVMSRSSPGPALLMKQKFLTTV